MKHLLLLPLLLPLFATAQTFSEFHIGATSRLGITGYGNVGHVNENNAGNGYLIAATAGFEHGFGFNAGGYAGWQWPGIAFYGGATYFAATNRKLSEGSRPYPLAGVQLKFDNRTIDLRYMGDAFHLAFGVRFGSNN